MALRFPNIDPVAFHIGPLEVHWYALAYIAGFLIGLKYCSYLCRKYSGSLRDEQYDNALSWMILGVILGGRLGYVLFYNFSYYLSEPLDIFKIWQGGMSFHGGIIGVTIALYTYCHIHKIQFMRFMDYIACAAPIGLFLGRIANFINQELWGRFCEASLPWCMVFPNAGYPYAPRHPSQLYEAVLEGIVLFTVLTICVHKDAVRKKVGALSGIFLIGYGLARFIVEYFRQPDEQLGFVLSNISMGQLLSLPMILLGLFFIATAKPAKKMTK